MVTKSGVAVASGGSAPVQRRAEPAFAVGQERLGGHDIGPRAAPKAAAPDWRPFLRALAAEIDAVAGTEARDALLRGVGRQLARMYPMPARESLDGLAMDMTETLDGFGWGAVRIEFAEPESCLILTHEGLPRVGGAGEPAGTWLAGTLVGLYEGWMAQQPGADASLVARRRASAEPETIVVRYGKD